MKEGGVVSSSSPTSIHQSFEAALISKFSPSHHRSSSNTEGSNVNSSTNTTTSVHPLSTEGHPSRESTLAAAVGLKRDSSSVANNISSYSGGSTGVSAQERSTVTDSGKSSTVTASGKSVTDSASSSAVRDSGNSVTHSGKSVTDSGKLVIDSGKSVIDSGKPVTDSGKTVIDSGKPLIDSGKSVTDSGKSVTDSGKSGVEEGQSTTAIRGEERSSTAKEGNATPTVRGEERSNIVTLPNTNFEDGRENGRSSSSSSCSSHGTIIPQVDFFSEGSPKIITNPFLPLLQNTVENIGPLEPKILENIGSTLTEISRSLSKTACSHAIKPLRLRNHSTGVSELYDTLHGKQNLGDATKTRCSEEYCLGSLVNYRNSRPAGVARSLEEVKSLAKDFFDQYYASIKRFNSTSHNQRWDQVLKELDETGTYDLTETELVYGAKLAWRNSVRCIGRIQWAKLQVFDARSVGTAAGMFEAICKHIKYGTNKGNIRSAITIFPQRTDAKHDFRVWNSTLLAYAGYRNPDGTILGDQLNLEFTDECIKLGWKAPRTRWDILPIVVSANGNDPEYFEIPPDLVVQVQLSHPTFDWFKDLELQWYILPAVSSMLFDCGGLEFPATPFNGWYMGTEIGCRDLGDTHRYNVLEDVALGMGLDTKNPTTLWKDRALVELNLAVLHSFQKAGATMVDHHTASESFMKHYENELKSRGGCPADWIWIVPPMSGSVTPVFHQEMAIYHLKPSYEYQAPAWKTHVWKKGATETGGENKLKLTRRKFHFKEIAKAVKFTSKLFGKALGKRVKATILYATETGRSELFARKLCEIFGHAFNAQVYAMNEYDIINIEHETLVLVVTSTFGNGDPPENGVSFAESLYELKMNHGDELNTASSKSFIKMNSQTDSVQSLDRKLDRSDSLRGNQGSDALSTDTHGILNNITYAVFGLGSSAYPNFCAFGKYVDNLLGELGGERLMKLTSGDELSGQDNAFRLWATEVFQIACDSFCLDSAMTDLPTDSVLSPETVRLFPSTNPDRVIKALSKVHSNRKVALYDLIERTNLNAPGTTRVTVNVVLKTSSGEIPLNYRAGDHVGIMADNRRELVEPILIRLANKPPSNDQPVQLELLEEKHTPMGVQKQWIPHVRFPCVSLQDLFTRFLDITTPPRPDLLVYFARCASDIIERETLEILAKDSDEYEHWKNWHWPDLAAVLAMFPSVSPDAGILCAMLPPLQPRFYSVSSSSLVHPNELHLTVAVVTYRPRGGEGPLHYGVCSNYLNITPIGTKVPCFVRHSSGFHMPSDITRPLIMVGPGSGIAPFRGFWQERSTKAPSDPIGRSKLGQMTLFFGCQTKEMILYRTELEKLKEDGILKDIFLALSREPNIKKTYVQDLIIREKENLSSQILEENGHVYVCGDCTMAEEVYQTLKRIVQERGRMNDIEIESYMLSLRDDNRYHEDIFGITHRTSEVVDKVRKTALSRIESNYALSQVNSPTSIGS